MCVDPRHTHHTTRRVVEECRENGDGDVVGDFGSERMPQVVERQTPQRASADSVSSGGDQPSAEGKEYSAEGTGIFREVSKNPTVWGD